MTTRRGRKQKQKTRLRGVQIAGKFPITIPGSFVASLRRFDPSWTPTPTECWKCHTLHIYLVSQRNAGPDCVVSHYHCVECGFHEDDYND